MENDVIDIIKSLNSNGINYFIIRDYQTIDNIINSKDIDIYIEKSQKKTVDELFKNKGWTNSYFNNNKYPHNQYFKMTNNKIYMFDVVYGFYYGKDNLKLELENITDKIYGRKIEDINIANQKVALITMLMHIIFDKREISEKNLKILEQMFNDYKDANSLSGELVEQIVSEILENKIELTNENIKKYQKEILNTNLLLRNNLKNFVIHIYIGVKGLISKFKRRLSNKTVAFIGIDGAGKSSIINCLSNIYGEKSECVYMGLKEFKNKKLEELMREKNNNFINKIKKRILLFIEMLSRYMKYRYSGKVVIFDRYVDDIVINSPNGVKKLDSFLFKILFPQPKLKIYVYCSKETSFSRKDDIEDKKEFEIMKYKYDNVYLKNKKVFKILTDNSSEEQSLTKVADIFNKNFKIAIF